MKIISTCPAIASDAQHTRHSTENCRTQTLPGVAAAVTTGTSAQSAAWTPSMFEPISAAGSSRAEASHTRPPAPSLVGLPLLRQQPKVGMPVQKKNRRCRRSLSRACSQLPVLFAYAQAKPLLKNLEHTPPNAKPDHERLAEPALKALLY